jgi:hypothetical protein
MLPGNYLEVDSAGPVKEEPHGFPRQMRHVLGWISNNRSHLVEVSWRSR